MTAHLRGARSSKAGLPAKWRRLAGWVAVLCLAAMAGHPADGASRHLQARHTVKRGAAAQASTERAAKDRSAKTAPGKDTANKDRSDAARKLLAAEQERAAQEQQKASAALALQAAEAEALKLGERRAQAAASLRDASEGAAAASERLRQAQATANQAAAELRQRAAAFSALVPLMLRMSRYPAETVLAVPAPPDQALTGLLLAGGIAATLNRQAASLRAQEAVALRLQQAASHQASVLSAERAREADAAAALDTAMAETRQRISEADAEGRKAAEQAAALAAQADTLRGAIAAMDAARAAAAEKAAREAATADRHKEAGAAASARARQAALSRPIGRVGAGQMLAPVTAPVLRGFGAPAVDGPTTGITYGPAPDAYVASPCTGRVGFAAPFRSYGQLVILECGGGLDMVLAGMGQIDTAPGRMVRAGEPIGRMPGAGKAMEAGKAGLYLEVRAHGQPVDPSPYLRHPS